MYIYIYVYNMYIYNMYIYTYSESAHKFMAYKFLEISEVPRNSHGYLEDPWIPGGLSP